MIAGTNFCVLGPIGKNIKHQYSQKSHLEVLTIHPHLYTLLVKMQINNLLPSMMNSTAESEKSTSLTTTTRAFWARVVVRSVSHWSIEWTLLHIEEIMTLTCLCGHSLFQSVSFFVPKVSSTIALKFALGSQASQQNHSTLKMKMIMTAIVMQNRGATITGSSSSYSTKGH